MRIHNGIQNMQISRSNAEKQWAKNTADGIHEAAPQLNVNITLDMCPAQSFIIPGPYFTSRNNICLILIRIKGNKRRKSNLKHIYYLINL